MRSIGLDVHRDFCEVAIFAPEFGVTFVPGTFREPLTWTSCG